MSPENKLIYELYEYHSSRIVNKVMYSLRKLKDENLLSGDDSGLNNAWDEICVQVQGKNSFNWDAYDETVKMFIKTYVEKEPTAIKYLLSYYDTDSYPDDNPTDTNIEIQLVYNEEDIINAMLQELLDKAVNYTNARIRNYLDNNY